MKGAFQKESTCMKVRKVEKKRSVRTMMPHVNVCSIQLGKKFKGNMERDEDEKRVRTQIIQSIYKKTDIIIMS